MGKLAWSTAVACAVVALSGCGGSDETEPTFTELQVINALGLPSFNGVSYESEGGCEIAVILDSKEEVSLYRDAGDDVLSNPSDTAGVKIVGACPDEEKLQKDLNTLTE